MPQQTQSQLISAFSDNTTGNITPLDMRNLISSIPNILDDENQPFGYPSLDADGNIVGKIVVYNDTAAALSTVILEQGQIGYAYDTYQLAVGDNSGDTFPNLSLKLDLNSGSLNAFSPNLNCPPASIPNNGWGNFVYYVEATGNNANNGLSPVVSGGNGPWADPIYAIQEIATTLGPGFSAIVNIGIGTFNLDNYASSPNNYLDLTGGNGCCISLVGAGENLTVIQSSILATHSAIVILGHSLYLGQLTVQGTQASGSPAQIAIADTGNNLFNSTIDRVNCNGATIPLNYGLDLSNLQSGNLINIYGSSITGASGAIKLNTFSLATIKIYGCTLTGTVSYAINATALSVSANLDIVGCSIVYKIYGIFVSSTSNFVSNIKLLNTVFTYTGSGSPKDVYINNTIGFYQRGCLGALGGNIISLGSPVYDPSTLGQVSLSELFATTIGGDVIAASNLVASSCLYIGGIDGTGTNQAVYSSNGFSISSYPNSGLFITGIDLLNGHLSLNSGLGGLVAIGNALILDGADFRMLNGTGTGASGANMWLDGANLNMGDGLGGQSSGIGSTLNVDCGLINLGGPLSGPLATIQADALANVITTGTTWTFNVGAAIFTGPVTVGQYTVATLPDPTTYSYAWAFATDARKPADGPGSGTGMMVFNDGSNWWLPSGLTPAI